MNAFESGTQKVIPAVLVYLRCGKEVLMLFRSGKKTGDVHLGKWNGLGGKCEFGETPADAALREMKEETGIQLEPRELNCLGVLQFPNFKPQKKEDWWVTVFSAEVNAKPRLEPCPEGELAWIPENQLLSLPLWRGDALFLPYVLAQKPFFGAIFYRGEEVIRSQIVPLANPMASP